MKPIYIHSGMAGAPQYANADGNINGILEACLINGFNLKTATSASASGGVLTLNFATNPGFEALQTVEVAVADVALVNGQHRVIANANNQVTIAIPGLLDGAVGSSGAGITIKQSSAGWAKPFSASTKAVFRPPAGNRRYLRVVNAVGADAQARGYEEMTDVDTGTGPFPTVAQVATPNVMENVSRGSPDGALWFLIASEKWVYFQLCSSAANNFSHGGITFGDAAEKANTTDLCATFLRVGNNLYICRNYAGAIGAVVGVDRSSDGGSAGWPSVITGGAQFIPYVPLLDYNSSVLRGVMPNAYKAYPEVPYNKFTDLYTNLTGTTSRMKPISAGVFSAMFACIAIDEDVWD